MRIRPIFAWYDLWVGAYWDRRRRRLYVLPLPCVGLVIEFRRDYDAQARSFAYGNVNIDDRTVTREMVDQASALSVKKESDR